ncbi:MAG: hypothetical protein K9H61_12770 [Bacteroidia bacterium]|nr:hypothetical protein [Bacteroidia bacterium]MCF8426224.1 hypothetical protein [Bacteroidia bacterium]MCF8447857.1 hypothetical protein [Bacteroidia bacterium]
MSYNYVNPYNGFGEMHNECMDYVSNNFSFGDSIDNLASVVIDFYGTKSGKVFSDFERQTQISDLISTFNYASINSDPFFVSNYFSAVFKVGLDKIKSICTNGSGIDTVITELNSLADEFKLLSVSSNDYQGLLGTIAIAQKSSLYWKQIVDNVGVTSWDPWLPPYDPNYETSAPLWVYADAAGFAVGYLRYTESHKGEDYNLDDCITQATLTASLFSAGFVVFVILGILL